jgi:hypothetical protein
MDTRGMTFDDLFAATDGVDDAVAVASPLASKTSLVSFKRCPDAPVLPLADQARNFIYMLHCMRAPSAATLGIACSTTPKERVPALLKEDVSHYAVTLSSGLEPVMDVVLVPPHDLRFIFMPLSCTAPQLVDLEADSFDLSVPTTMPPAVLLVSLLLCLSFRRSCYSFDITQEAWTQTTDLFWQALHRKLRQLGANPDTAVSTLFRCPEPPNPLKEEPDKPEEPESKRRRVQAVVQNLDKEFRNLETIILDAFERIRQLQIRFTAVCDDLENE